MYGDCADGTTSVRYRGDGALHCGAGGGADVLCMQFAAAGGNATVKATVSRFDGAVFSDNIDLVLQDVGGSSQQPFGCMLAKGHKTVSFALDPSVFGMVLGDTLSIEADATSPCSGGDAWYSDSGTISQCKP
jgi:hypothetical protein